MKLIIDSGATKGHWMLLDGHNVVLDFTTKGANFSFISEDCINSILDDAFLRLGIYAEAVREVHFYAAGIGKLQDYVAETFGKTFRNASFNMESDLLGAARAVCGYGPGVVAILGTGSASCMYDGVKIVSVVNSGGFILGDEGSAARLGKMFISDYIKNFVPAPLCDEFESRYKLDYQEIVKNVYHNIQSPSAYLGSFAPFVVEHYSHPYAKTLTDRNFDDFFDRMLSRYDLSDKPLGLVGGFACACREIIASKAAERGLSLKCILREPIEGLALYHQKG